MPVLTFDWDPRKDRANQLKHGVSFDEAKTAFLDEYARIIPDPEHSEDEERFVLLGMSVGLRLLVVCHCYREPEDLIRIISARRADKSERREYARYLP
jgi:uncharacterized DUF497 family protein